MPDFITAPLLNDRVKSVEFRCMVDICKRNNLVPSIVKAFEWKWGTFCPNHEVLAVWFIPTYSSSFVMSVELIPLIDYPYTEPVAVVVDPDIQRLRARDGSPLHVYPHTDNGLNYRIICAHMTGSTPWNSSCTLAMYFLNCVLPWAHNFDRFLATNGEWHPVNWRGIDN